MELCKALQNRLFLFLSVCVFGILFALVWKKYEQPVQFSLLHNHYTSALKETNYDHWIRKRNLLKDPPSEEILRYSIATTELNVESPFLWFNYNVMDDKLPDAIKHFNIDHNYASSHFSVPTSKTDPSSLFNQNVMDNKLPGLFKHVKIDHNVYRCNILSENDVQKWIAEYSKETNSGWIIKFHATAPSRFLSRCVFSCHHTSFRRLAAEENKRGNSKNTHCKAEIEIKIKLITSRTRGLDIFIKEGLPAILTFKGNHNHSQNTAEALSFLKPSEDVRETFEAYFSDGLTIKEAMNLHESKLEIDFSESGTEMANSSINPKYRTVQHWYTVWLAKNLGARSGNGMIDKLIEKKEIYRKEGILVEVQSEPFAAVIVTEIMQRAHEMPFSKDIVFVDSTASCDAESHSVTFMLSPCSIGAIPLSVLITKGQSIEDYVAAFSLLQKCMPTAFKGQGFPKIFITDDSSAERSALKIVWPGSKLLLCRFHVCQAVWRWLFEKKNNIDKEDRPILYYLFQAILVAATEDLAEKVFYDAIANPISRKYENFLNYLNEYWKRKELWCLARRDATTHGHQTNNFSEVNVRLFKDIVLLRNKAYNVVSLVNFTCTSLEKYYLQRLRYFANCRQAAPRLFLKAALKKASYLTKEAIQKIEEKLYRVPKESSSGFYEVDALVGFCSCDFGRLGRFCKHQAGVFQHFNEALPNAPPVTPESRHEIAKIAFGEKAPPLNFYMPLEIQAEDADPMNFVVTPQSCISQTENVNLICREENDSDFSLGCEAQIINYESTSENNSSEIFAEKENIDLTEQLMNVFKSNFSKFKTSPSVVAKCLERASKVKTDTAWESFLSSAGSQVALRHHPRTNIHVQPTAISRRTGLMKGTKKLPAGRPPLKSKENRLKRKRNLALNVKLNQANAKCHGLGH